MPEVKKTVTVNRQSTRAKFDLNSFNEADRTIEVIFATETPIKAYDWSIGDFVEVLSCEPSHVDLSRMNSGAPVLDNHDKYSSTRKAVVGVVESARVESNQCIAKVRFSNASDDDVELMNKVKDGIVTGVSVGYDVFAYQLTRSNIEGQLDTYKAIDWQPTEISFVPVQADINSRVRSEGETSNEVTVEDVTPVEETEESQVEEIEEIEEIENNTNLKTNDMPEVNQPPATPAAEVPNMEQIRSEERARSKGISAHCRALGLSQAVADALIEENIDLATAGQRALVEWEKLQPANPNPTVQQVVDNKDKVRSAMSNALTLRIDPKSASVMGEENVRAANEYKGQNLLRFAEEALIREGVRTSGMTPREIAVFALGGKVRGLHHTTDFPLLLMDTVNRTLLAQYELQARTFMPWARRATINDFRPVSRIRLSEILGDLEKVREGEEYKYGTLSESGETYQLAKYGKIIGITWEAIINDDLSAFTRIPQAFAAKAAQLQSNLVYNTLLSGGFANMGDGNALFSAAHGNFTGTAANQTAGGTALSEASLTTAFQGFMNQKGPDGSFITVAPKYLVVGPKNAFLAMKMTSSNYTPNTQANIPVGALVGLTVIVEPRLTNYEWFLIADPAMIDTVEYAFLAGEDELFIEQREGFNIDGIEVKARMVFAAKAIDWRGLYRNNGAAPA